MTIIIKLDVGGAACAHACTSKAGAYNTEVTRAAQHSCTSMRPHRRSSLSSALLFMPPCNHSMGSISHNTSHEREHTASDSRACDTPRKGEERMHALAVKGSCHELMNDYGILD